MVAGSAVGIGMWGGGVEGGKEGWGGAVKGQAG